MRVVLETNVLLATLPRVTGSPDPADDFLLAMSQSAKANYLVTGDKSGLLALKKHGQTQIVTAVAFARLID